MIAISFAFSEQGRPFRLCNRLVVERAVQAAIPAAIPATPKIMRSEDETTIGEDDVVEAFFKAGSRH
jgi:hypothetical protein